MIENQGDLSVQIQLLKKWIDIADANKQPGLVDKLTATLSKVVESQDRRNVLMHNLLSGEAAARYFEEFRKIVAAVFNDAIADKELLGDCWDEIGKQVAKMRPMENDANDRKLLGK